MSDAARPRKGLKIDQSAKAGLDAKRLPVTKAITEDEVSGQNYYESYTECPYCFNVGWTSNLNTDFYVAVQCGGCGQMFMA